MPPFPFSDCCLGSGAHLLFHASQPAKAPGGHINYIAAPPLFSHVYLWVCLLSQTMPICSLSISTALYSYLLCVYVRSWECVCGFVLMFTNISLHMYKCTRIHAHTPAPSLRQVIMVGGKILPREHSLPQAQLYNRLRCVCACVCGCLCRAWLLFLFKMSLSTA